MQQEVFAVTPLTTVVSGISGGVIAETFHCIASTTYSKNFAVIIIMLFYQ